MSEVSVVGKRAAELILSQQTADGAITMGKLDLPESSVISYFGCFAAQGLVARYRSTHEPKLLDGAKRWTAWYAKHQNPDGTIYDYKGRNEAWVSTGHYDSTDSYAAVYLDLIADIYRTKPDRSWLEGLKPSIVKAYAGIRLTMQSSGLTCATPTYPVEYTMDNVETLLGLRSLMRLASLLGDSSLEHRAKADSDRMEAAIDTLLWNREQSCYRIAVQPDGGKIDGLEKWYPDIMANLMPIAWLPPSTRNKELFARLKAKFGHMIPERIGKTMDLEQLVWWGWGAKGAGDQAMLDAIRERLSGFETVCAGGCNPTDLGHILRLLE